MRKIVLQTTFFKEYQKIEAFLYREHVPIEVLIPLSNVTSNSSEIDLSKHANTDQKLYFKKLTESEKYFFHTLERLGMNLAVKSDYLLLIHSEEKKQFGQENIGGDNADFQNQIDKLIMALRLLKPGSVGTSIAYFKPFIGKLSHSFIYKVDLEGIITSNAYEFNTDDVIQPSNILRSLKGTWNKNLKIALRRFDSTYEKTKNADKLIDLMIAYESLFSRINENNDSVSYKLALRLARLLGNDEKTRKEIYKKIRDLYVKRNQIVHGSIDDVEKNTIEEAEEIIRKAIREYLSMYLVNQFVDHDSFIDYLDFTT